ncbi:hypothetical protein BC831DRAFT_548774 [Entophlyctis helioformis]|nr:hypothetical protein BC831DRAFT_548774 [Entophlyctis helioformis]
MQLIKTALVLLAGFMTVVSAAGKPNKMQGPAVREDPTLVVKYDFPRSKFAIFNSGEVGLVRINVTNTGTEIREITGVETVFTYANDPMKIISKSLPSPLTFTVLPNATIVYKHFFTSTLEAQDAVLKVLLTCYNDVEYYRILAVAAPVTIVYSDSLFDLKSIVMYIFAVILMGLTGYFFYAIFFMPTNAKPSKSAATATKTPGVKKAPVLAPAVEAAAMDKQPDMEWIPNHVAHQQKLSNSPKLKKRK